MNPQTQKIYDTAVANYEKHCTLNPAIPQDVGCAEAVSFILQKAGVADIPKLGISGTATLYQWLLKNPHFTRIEGPQAGAIIVSPTGYGNGTIPGHTGIVGALGKVYPNDWGIVSNDSQTGLLLEYWNMARWKKYYAQFGGLPVAFFLAK